MSKNFKQSNTYKIEDNEQDLTAKIERIVHFAYHAVENFEKGDKKTKREIFFALSSNLFLKDGKLLITAKKGILFLKKSNDSLVSLLPENPKFEPIDNGLCKGESGCYNPLNTVWLGRIEYIARYFAFEKGAYWPNLKLEERLANETDEWVMAGAKQGA
jgi:hypothetical protein